MSLPKPLAWGELIYAGYIKHKLILKIGGVWFLAGDCEDGDPGGPSQWECI
jgi:hypothetical protein